MAIGPNGEIGVRLNLQGRRQFVSDADAAERAIKRIDRTAGSATISGRALSGTFGLMGAGIGSLVGVASRGATVLAGFGAVGAAAFVGLGVQAMGGYEQAQIGFETMLGSVDKAKSLITEIETYAIKSPFAFPEVLTATRKLVAMGIEGDQVVDVVKNLGDAAAGLGLGSEGLGRMANAIGQIQTKGFPSGEEMRQLADAGIPAWRYLSDYIGKSMQETQKLAENRMISSGTAISAILAGVNAEMGGMVVAQNETLFGKWEIFTDTVRQTARLSMTEFAGDMKNALDYITVQFQKFATYAQERFPDLISSLREGLSGDSLGLGLDKTETRFFRLGRVIDQVTGKGPKNWQAIATAIGLIIDPAGRLTPIIDTISDIFRDVSTIVQESLLPALDDIGPILKFLIQPLTLLDDILSFLADNTMLTKNAFELLFLVWAGYKVVGLVEGAVLRLDKVIVNTKDRVNNFKTAWQRLRTQMNLWIIRAKVAIVQMWGMVTATWATLAPALLMVAIIVLIVAALYLLYTRSETVRNAVNKFWQDFQRGWDIVLGYIGGFIDTLSQIPETLDGIWDGLYEQFVEIWDKIKGKWDEVKGWFGDLMPDWFGSGNSPTTLPTGPTSMPGMADGGHVRKSGWSMIGERGPEMLNLNAGATVVPLTNDRATTTPESESTNGRATSGRFEVVDGGQVLFEIVAERARSTAARR